MGNIFGEYVTVNGTMLKRIRFGGRGDVYDVSIKIPPRNPYCPGCGVKLGELHRIGCDLERCPACGGQIIGCLSGVCGCATLDSQIHRVKQTYQEGTLEDLDNAHKVLDAFKDHLGTGSAFDAQSFAALAYLAGVNEGRFMETFDRQRKARQRVTAKTQERYAKQLKEAAAVAVYDTDDDAEEFVDDTIDIPDLPDFAEVEQAGVN